MNQQLALGAFRQSQQAVAARFVGSNTNKPGLITVAPTQLARQSLPPTEKAECYSQACRAINIGATKSSCRANSDGATQAPCRANVFACPEWVVFASGWSDRSPVAPLHLTRQSSCRTNVSACPEWSVFASGWRDRSLVAPLQLVRHASCDNCSAMCSCYVLLLSLYGSLLFPTVFSALHCWSSVRFSVSDHIKFFFFALLMVSVFFSV